MDSNITPELFVESVRLVLSESTTDTEAVELITELVDRVPSHEAVLDACLDCVADAERDLTASARGRIADSRRSRPPVAHGNGQPG